MKTNRRGVCLLLIAALLIAALPLASLAQPIGVYLYVANTSSLNLRSGPGYEYPVITGVARNEIVQVLGYHAGGAWVNVLVLSSAQQGYMDSSFLSPTPVSPEYPGSTRAMVKNPVPTSFLNLREEPSYSARVLGIYYNGTLCTVLSQSGGWYHVQMDTGLKGYFLGEFLTFDLSNPGPPIGGQGTAKIISSGGRVNLRQGPGYSYPVLESYYPGKTVTVYSKGSGFWQISVDGTIGFMDGRFLQMTGTDIPGPGAANAAVKSGAALNLRQQPTTGAKILGVYPGGTPVNVLKQGLEWSYAAVPSTGLSGYFMTKYLSLHGLPEIPTKIVKHPTGSYVNLRSLPNVSTGVVNVRMPHNSVVTVLVPGGAWTRVRFGTVKGYVMSSFLK